MTDDQQYIVGILVKYALRQPLDEAEIQALAQWRAKSAEHDQLPEQFRDPRWVEEQRQQLHPPPTAEMWADIRQHIDETGVPAPILVLPQEQRVGYRWLSTAAIVVLILVLGVMQWRQPAPASGKMVQLTAAASLFKARLTLGDGRMIGLDTLARGGTIREGDVQLTKTDSNSYVYTFLRGSEYIKAPRHRLVLSAGSGTYRVQWPDGSYAWLKKGTILDYPVDWRSAVTRLDGEAFFEVAHQAGRPVLIGLPDDGRVVVLGTRLNVRTTADSGSRVSLFSGRVRVVRGADSLLLPEGSETGTGSPLRASAMTDSDAVSAWTRPEVRKPAFDFNDVDLRVILPELTHSYGVHIANPFGLQGTAITGRFPRQVSLTMMVEDLQILEKGFVRMTLKNDTLYIAPPS